MKDMKTRKQRAMADLVFVGLGVSNATALQRLLTRLIEKPPQEALRISLIEKHEVHYTGVAYGPRSGPNSLIISTLEDFIDPAERHEFIDWLKANETWLLSTFRQRGGELSGKWCEAFKSANSDEIESKICVPRTFFGYFLREKINRLIDTASALGHVKITSITAEVVDVQRSAGGYKLKLSNSDQALLTRKLVLGIGPPAHRTLARANELVDGTHIVDNPYEGNIGTLCRSLAKGWLGSKGPGARRNSLNILMVGSNASAIEASYLLSDQKELRRLIKRITVLSPAGAFPERRPEWEARALLGYQPNCLEELATCEVITAREIYLAFLADIHYWKSLDTEGRYPMVALGKEVVACLHKLNRAQKKLFTNRYGVLIGKHQRRSGDEYLDFASQAGDAQRLVHVKGRFMEVESHGKAGYQVSHLPAGADAPSLMDDPFHLIINCMGPTSLHEPQAPLLSQLIKRGLCKVNESGRGFKVRDDYTVADNFVVTGPLISGNVISKQAVWHVEHCGRLTAIGKVVGDRLHGQLLRATEVGAAA